MLDLSLSNFSNWPALVIKTTLFKAISMHDLRHLIRLLVSGLKLMTSSFGI